MCECGCGELRPFGKFPAPNGQTYVLEIYPGCGDCGVGPGVSVHRFTRAQLREMGWSTESARDEIPDLPWRTDRAECAIPVLDLDTFRETFEGEDEECFYGMSNIGDALRTAVGKTLTDFLAGAGPEEK